MAFGEHQRVTARVFDGWIDLYEILALYGMGVSEQSRVVYVVSAHSKGQCPRNYEIDDGRCWTAIGNARFVCKWLHLEKKLGPLLDFASRKSESRRMTDDNRETFGFLTPWFVPYRKFSAYGSNDHSVYVRVHDHKVNITQLARLAGRPMPEVTKLLSSWNIQREVVRSGFHETRGSYVELEIALMPGLHIDI
jgi:hypothetical protein